MIPTSARLAKANSTLSVILGMSGVLVVWLYPPYPPTPTQPTEIALDVRPPIGVKDPWGATLAIWGRPWGRPKNMSKKTQENNPPGLQKMSQNAPPDTPR